MAAQGRILITADNVEIVGISISLSSDKALFSAYQKDQISDGDLYQLKNIIDEKIPLLTGAAKARGELISSYFACFHYALSKQTEMMQTLGPDDLKTALTSEDYIDAEKSNVRWCDFTTAFCFL